MSWWKNVRLPGIHQESLRQGGLLQGTVQSRNWPDNVQKPLTFAINTYSFLPYF